MHNIDFDNMQSFKLSNFIKSKTQAQQAALQELHLHIKDDRMSRILQYTVKPYCACIHILQILQ